jgi:hypothetical protein
VVSWDIERLPISLIDTRDIRGSSHALKSRATLHTSHYIKSKVILEYKLQTLLYIYPYQIIIVLENAAELGLSIEIGDSQTFNSYCPETFRVLEEKLFGLGDIQC